MKVLNLIIKQKWFDEILAGRKTEEYREVRPTTLKKYLRYEVDGKEYETLDHPDLKDRKADLEFSLNIIDYDAIRFFVGYNKDRDSALVEVKDAFLTLFTDDNDEYITYDHDGNTYIASEMTYKLGKVLEQNVHPKK